MPDLDDGQWRLVYPGTDFVFGTPATPTYFESAPAFSDAEVRAEDTNRPRQDGTAFGVDYRGGQTITFALGVYGDDEAAARSAMADLTRAWRGDAVRGTAGTVAELQMQTADRLRSVFGRPRRFAPVYEEIKDGIGTVDADFACVDDVFYGPAETAAFAIAPPTGGGLEAPLAAPLTTTANSDRSASITVAGELPAWPVVTFDGPITNPELEIIGLWTMTLAVTLAFDQSVTIDTAPWARTVLRNDGASLAGAFTRDSIRMARAAVPPGAYGVVLRGIDSTGTAQVHVTWRTAYSTP